MFPTMELWDQLKAIMGLQFPRNLGRRISLSLSSEILSVLTLVVLHQRFNVFAIRGTFAHSTPKWVLAVPSRFLFDH